VHKVGVKFYVFEYLDILTRGWPVFFFPFCLGGKCVYIFV